MSVKKESKGLKTGPASQIVQGDRTINFRIYYKVVDSLLNKKLRWSILAPSYRKAGAILWKMGNHNSAVFIWYVQVLLHYLW